MNGKFLASIFNDVLAPIASGPSSSNTMGPWRIGMIARQMLDEKPEHLKIEMSSKGGYKDTFFSMGSDRAFVAGVLGKDLLKIDMNSVYELASKEGLEYEFVFTDSYPSFPTEMADLTLRTENETLTLTAVSLGGGEIEINKVNDCHCSIDGRTEIEFEVPGTCKRKLISKVYPLNYKPSECIPFASSEELLQYVTKEKLGLWETALEYEKAVTGEDKDFIWGIAGKTLDAAYTSISNGKRNDVVIDGITDAKASQILGSIESAHLVPLGAADYGAFDALSIMEYASAHGTIVCMPTGGAAGVIPASIKATAFKLGLKREDEIKALLVSGLIGTFYYPTHYHGSLGCQAEVGVATSMAAAGIASMLTDDAEVIERAAVLAMQVLIGQVCDPIGGYTQIPCFIRNVTAVPIAMTCANYAVLGIESGVNLDEMVKAVLRVGEKIRDNRISDCGTCMCSFQEKTDRNLKSKINDTQE